LCIIRRITTAMPAVLPMNRRNSIGSFAEVIDVFGSCAALGAALGEKSGTVRQWRNRNRIPPDRWLGVAQAAKRLGENRISVALMARLAARAH
jgi:hypothetical protein